MYTFLICQDNSLIATEKERIMEKTSLVDTLQFLVEKQYNGYDMAEFDLIFEGYKPITHEIEIMTLELVDNNYKDLYYAYRVPVNSGITKEAGDMQFSLSFLKSDLDERGNVINYVRRVEVGHINILPVESWFSPSDAALTKLTQLYLNNQQNIMALRDVANSLAANAPNDIEVKDDGSVIYLTHDNVRMGNGITIATLANLINNVNGNTIVI